MIVALTRMEGVAVVSSWVQGRAYLKVELWERGLALMVELERK